jgi:hypothetical protein
VRSNDTSEPVLDLRVDLPRDEKPEFEELIDPSTWKIGRKPTR